MKKTEDPMPERLINRIQLRQLIPVSDDTLNRWVKDRRFPSPMKIGRRLFWRWVEIETWIEKNR